MGLGNLGISELLVIFVIVLVFFGPRRMPEIARSLGSAMREFRRSLNQIQREFEEADPRSALRPDRSVLDRMPESVRPHAPTQAGSGAEPTREGAAPADPAPGRGAHDSAAWVDEPGTATGPVEEDADVRSPSDGDSGSD